MEETIQKPNPFLGLQRPILMKVQSMKLREIQRDIFLWRKFEIESKFKIPALYSLVLQSC